MVSSAYTSIFPTRGGSSSGFGNDTDELRRLHEQALADMEQLREQEENLRAYERRLREESLAVSAGNTAQLGEAERAAEWNKLRNARALLESEKIEFIAERQIVRDVGFKQALMDRALRSRETAIAQREKALRERALVMAVAAPAGLNSRQPFTR